VQLNATLPYGGEMTLFLESAGIKELEWQSVPITFGEEPKKYVYPLSGWYDINTILIYSAALQLDVYYNVVNLREAETNIKTYQFPTPDDHDRRQQGNPLRKVMIVPLDDALLNQRGCKDTNNYCIVTLSLYPNLNVEYSQ
jgi:hypothetical protein